jgi:L-glyceraldehyde 3-phosphate reductase
MQYRSVGNTGLEISEIGFGTGGTAGLMIAGSHEEQLSTVRRALDLGINYFDESPDYGDGVSEENLGKVLRELGATDAIITTKVEVRQENLDDIAGHVERSVEASLKRLGRDHVDFIQIHNGPVATRPELRGRAYNILGIEDYLAKGGAIEGLERIKKAGKTRFIGFICRGNDGTQVRQLIDTGVFHLINIVYTVINPSAARAARAGESFEPDFGNVIPYAREHGVGVAIYSPLAGGSLSDGAVAGLPPHPLAGARGRPQAQPAAEGRAMQGDAPAEGGGRGQGGGGRPQQRRGSAFSFLSVPGKHSLAQGAVRFILMEAGVTTVLGGFSAIEQLEEIAAVPGTEPLSADLMGQIENVWRTPAQAPSAT